MQCTFKGCVYQAVPPSTLCVQHKPAQRQAGDEDYSIVKIGEVPKNARFNQAAADLRDAVKVLQEGNALKVRLAKIPKPTCVTAQRYALEAGLRIGVRFCGPLGYLWKLTPDEIKIIEKKGERLRAARAKKGKSK